MEFTEKDLLDLAREIKINNPSLSSKDLVQAVKNEIKILFHSLKSIGNTVEIKGE